MKKEDARKEDFEGVQVLDTVKKETEESDKETDMDQDEKPIAVSDVKTLAGVLFKMRNPFPIHNGEKQPEMVVACVLKKLRDRLRIRQLNEGESDFDDRYIRGPLFDLKDVSFEEIAESVLDLRYSGICEIRELCGIKGKVNVSSLNYKLLKELDIDLDKHDCETLDFEVVAQGKGRVMLRCLSSENDAEITVNSGVFSPSEKPYIITITKETLFDNDDVSSQSESFEDSVVEIRKSKGAIKLYFYENQLYDYEDIQELMIEENIGVLELKALDADKNEEKDLTKHKLLNKELKHLPADILCMLHPRRSYKRYTDTEKKCIKELSHDDTKLIEKYFPTFATTMKNNRWRWAREDDDNASSVSNVSQKSDKNNLPVAMIDLPRMKRQLKEDIKKIVEEKFDELEINIKEHHENLVKEIKTVRQCVSEVYSEQFKEMIAMFKEVREDVKTIKRYISNKRDAEEMTRSAKRPKL
mmetsp:Transcript_17176/g.25769  ORF Transcript_17176/g.25769 Transcript_17176/m.25769 type:complete len:471 (+) Transcript_17176:46-1458(+)